MHKGGHQSFQVFLLLSEEILEICILNFNPDRFLNVHEEFLSLSDNVLVDLISYGKVFVSICENPFLQWPSFGDWKMHEFSVNSYRSAVSTFDYKGTFKDSAHDWLFDFFEVKFPIF
jgi:hypothetical protein